MTSENFLIVSSREIHIPTKNNTEYIPMVLSRQNAKLLTFIPSKFMAVSNDLNKAKAN